MTKHHQTGSALTFGIIIAVVALVGLGAAYYFTDGFGTNAAQNAESNETGNTSTEAKTDEPAVEKATGKATLAMVKNAFAGNGSIKCVADTKYEGKYTTATIYIKSQDKYRMDMRSDMGTMHMIILNQKTNYTWAEGQDRGTKMTLSKSDKTIDEEWQSYVDFVDDEDNKVNGEKPRLNCEKTTLSNSLFDLPKGIKFSDMSPYTVDER